MHRLAPAKNEISYLTVARGLQPRPAMETTARNDVPHLAIPLVLWGAAALALVASGALALLPRPVIPATLGLSVIAFFGAARRPGFARSVLEGLDLRAAVGLHVIRAPIGAAFLVMGARGLLPASFALPAGVGDVAAGLGALAALTALPATTRARRLLVLFWNAGALADILMVIVLAQRLILFGDATPFLAFPFPMLPLFVVPLVLITHGIVFWRLGRREA